jgi:hypothetical protein
VPAKANSGQIVPLLAIAIPRGRRAARFGDEFERFGLRA